MDKTFRNSRHIGIGQIQSVIRQALPDIVFSKPWCIEPTAIHRSRDGAVNNNTGKQITNIQRANIIKLFISYPDSTLFGGK